MPPPAKRRKFSTPTQRLLRKLFDDHVNHGSQTSPLISPKSSPPLMKDVTSARSDEVEMTDGNSSISNAGATTYPLPSQAAHTHNSFKGVGAPRLHLSTLPPVPAFPTSATSGSSSSTSATTPGLTSVATAQSPTPMNSVSGPASTLTIAATNSTPARKKLSLGDYMSRRLASTPSSEKTQAQTVLGIGEADSIKSEASPSEQLPALAEANTGGSQVDELQNGDRNNEDVAMKDRIEEQEYSPPEPLESEKGPLPPVPSPGGVPSSGEQNTIPQEVTNVLAQLAQIGK
jgi:hypothetical protein